MWHWDVCDNEDMEVEEQHSCPWSSAWLLWGFASAPRPSLAGHALLGMEVMVALVYVLTSP